MSDKAASDTLEIRVSCEMNFAGVVDVTDACRSAARESPIRGQYTAAQLTPQVVYPARPGHFH